jgi:flagellar assembly factor FliW
MQITRSRVDDAEAQTDESTTVIETDIPDGVLIDFAGGLPGFPASRQFRLERLAPELDPFCVMRSVNEAEICFVLVPPGAMFPDYTIEIDEQHVASLGLETADDAVVMTIVTLGEPPTANLLGPVVVNRLTRSAAQVVQYQADYRAAEPLTPRSEG